MKAKKVYVKEFAETVAQHVKEEVEKKNSHSDALSTLEQVHYSLYTPVFH